MISGVWIGLISFNDKNLTIGTAAEYNHALVGPLSQGFQKTSNGYVPITYLIQIIFQ